jgi:hypothetical protein
VGGGPLAHLAALDGHRDEPPLNRYYDPATDQFLSADPDVAATDEPYAFTGDDPLNEIDPLGLYRYRYTERLGRSRNIGSAAQAMHYFLEHFRQIFPFTITGRGGIRDGSNLTLHPASAAFNGVGNVVVQHVTSTSFTFKVTSTHYFDPKGSTITFSTSESDGEDYLHQYGNAPEAGTKSNLSSPTVAAETWMTQASNLSDALAGSPDYCHQSLADTIGSKIVGWLSGDTPSLCDN